jgi:hypothetical protein
MRTLIAALVVLGGLAPAAAARALPNPPVAYAAAVCADYPSQAAAQRAADTVDADGVYCESLPSVPEPGRTRAARSDAGTDGHAHPHRDADADADADDYGQG